MTQREEIQAWVDREWVRLQPFANWLLGAIEKKRQEQEQALKKEEIAS